MRIPRGTPVIYKFQQFPEEYGIVIKKVKNESNVYIINFLERINPHNRKLRICTDYLEIIDNIDNNESLDKMNQVKNMYNKIHDPFPTIKDAIHKGMLYILKGTVCAISHMDLEDGEEVVILHNNKKNIYSRNWIEPYWKFLNSMNYPLHWIDKPRMNYPPRHPILNTPIVCQKDVERFNVKFAIYV